MSELLREARSFESEAGEKICPQERPSFHLTPRAGWMNDPNGFIFYKGMYHLFYQYYPYRSAWGSMHWGHAVSSDLLHWSFLPAAMAPDEVYDHDGCFSGSAVTLPDGRLMLMYTGERKEEMPDGRETDIQTQCLAFGDGTDFVKYEGNPVLNGSVLPEGGSRADFRDPKIWQEKDGTYACVIANRSSDGSGQILLFRSADAIQWKFGSVLASNRNRFGRMWECPDFFELDGKWVLLASAQQMLADGGEYHGGYGTLCMIGNCSPQDGHFVEETIHPIDSGLDFYATQTLLAPDGRRIMVGWMQNWDTVPLLMPDTKWFGQMSLPRELSVKDGRLIQMPVREINACRKDEVVYENEAVTGGKTFPKIKGRWADIELTVNFKAGKIPEHEGNNDNEGTPDRIYSCSRFEFRFAKDNQFYTSVTYTPADSMLIFDRTFSGSRRDMIDSRKCRTDLKDGILKLRIILDLFSAEVFVNDGRQVLSSVIYTEPSADQMSFSAEGTVMIDIKKYDISTDE